MVASGKRLARIASPPLILAAIALLGACSGPSTPPATPTPAKSAHPSVLLITIDTWRWDYLGVSEQRHVETPNLDRIAAEGVYVRKMQTTCPLTTPAHATIMTGLSPREHGIRDNQHFSLKPGVTTLAQRFKEAGYRTGAVISGAPLRKTYGLNRGFDDYDDSGLGAEGDNAFSPFTRPGNQTTDLALAWLGRQAAVDPVFLWVHYYDPHWPYAPPRPFLDRYATSPYAGEIAFVDSQIGRLLDALRSDRQRDWIVVATGDHGEGLGDHGESTHGILLYASTVDVPFILWTGQPQSALAAGPFSLEDVAPTLCEAARIAPAIGEGRSIFKGGTEPRWLAAESAYPALAHGLGPAVLLRRDFDVYLDQGDEEVYDLEVDPGEVANLAGTPEGNAFAKTAAAARARIFGDEMEKDLFGGDLALKGHDLDALKGLGYVSTVGAGTRPLRRVDLRKFAADMGRFQTARQELSAKRFAEALAEYDAFLAAYPDSAIAHQERGQVLRSMGRLDLAEASFARALSLDPRDAVSALAMGNIALAREDYPRAERFFLESIRDEEGQAEAHLNLGLLYVYKLRRPADAKPHFLRFLELAPADPEAAEIGRLAASLPGNPRSGSSKSP
jgi:choline-sulfatase